MSPIENQGMQPTQSTIWVRVRNTSWFVRGALGAWPLLAALEAITPFEKLEILRALHAIILSWNELIEWFGQLIGKLPFIPNLPVWFLNSFAICSLLVLGNIGHKGSSVYFPNQFRFKNFFYAASLLVGFNIIFTTPEIRGLGYFGIIVALLGFIEDNVNSRVDEIIKPIWWCVIITFIFYIIYHPFPVITGRFAIIVLIPLMMIMGTLFYSSRTPIKNGILFSVGFTLVFTCLYALNQPAIKNFVNEATNSVLEEANEN